MNYNIFSSTAPAMPKPGKGMEIVKLLLSQASKDMYEPLVPMFFPSLGAHVCGVEFMYPDYSWKELCGLMANIVADSGCNKGQLSPLVEAICIDSRLHDITQGYRQITLPYSAITQGYFFAHKGCKSCFWLKMAICCVFAQKSDKRFVCYEDYVYFCSRKRLLDRQSLII